MNILIGLVFFRHGFLYDEIGQRVKIQNHGILFNQICKQIGKAAPFILIPVRYTDQPSFPGCPAVCMP